jgi:hypothetical protein
MKLNTTFTTEHFTEIKASPDVDRNRNHYHRRNYYDQLYFFLNSFKKSNADLEINIFQ